MSCDSEGIATPSRVELMMHTESSSCFSLSKRNTKLEARGVVETAKVPFPPPRVPSMYTSLNCPQCRKCTVLNPSSEPTTSSSETSKGRKIVASFVLAANPSNEDRCVYEGQTPLMTDNNQTRANRQIFRFASGAFFLVFNEPPPTVLATTTDHNGHLVFFGHSSSLIFAQEPRDGTVTY